MRIRLRKNFKERLAGRFGKYSFEVGVINDGPHMLPAEGAVVSSYAGGPVRRKSSKPSGQSISDVSRSLRNYLNENYLSEPFKKKSSDIIKFSKEFFKLVFGRSEKKRVENLLQAIVRNPMLRGDYGRNEKVTQEVKGFDRITIDTGQLFKSIKAIVKVKNV